jgi:hypothetical protein
MILRGGDPFGLPVEALDWFGIACEPSSGPGVLGDDADGMGVGLRFFFGYSSGEIAVPGGTKASSPVSEEVSLSNGANV